VSAAGDGRWVLFDLDGTLFDYAAAETRAVSATLRDVGVRVTDAVLDDYRRVNARHWTMLERRETTPERLRLERWSETLAAHTDDEVDVAALSERYLVHLAAAAPLIPGAAEVVGDLADRFRIAFVTNGLADVQRPRLEASPLAEAAEVLIISDEVGAAKPDAAIFQATFEAMGGPRRDAVTMVGDSLSADIAGAADFGLPTVWFAPPGTPGPEASDPVPTHRIAELRELPSLLG
jgi:YjjG family noncanonical pyrimidine nucleotidase